MANNKVTQRRAVFERDALPLMELLFGGAQKLTRNTRDAEDLVQDTYVRSFERFHLFKPGTNLKAWMFRVMTNRFINLYRRRKTRRESANYDDVEGLFGSEDQQLLSDFQSSEALGSLMENESFLDSLDDSLKHALEGLTDDYREVLLMNVVGEMSYKEIAKGLAIPVGTVMSRLSRAKSLMRERVSELGREEIPGADDEAVEVEGSSPWQA